MSMLELNLIHVSKGGMKFPSVKMKYCKHSFGAIPRCGVTHLELELEMHESNQ